MTNELEVKLLRTSAAKLTAARNFIREHAGNDCTLEQEAMLWRSISKMLVPSHFADDSVPERAAQ